MPDADPSGFELLGPARSTASSIAKPLAATPGSIPRAAEIVLYTGENYQTATFGMPPLRVNLGMNFSQDDGYNDRIASIIVVSGTWKVCVDKDLGGKCVVLPPGYYPNAHAFGLDGPNEGVSSFNMVAY